MRATKDVSIPHHDQRTPCLDAPASSCSIASSVTMAPAREDAGRRTREANIVLTVHRCWNRWSRASGVLYVWELGILTLYTRTSHAASSSKESESHAGCLLLSVSLHLLVFLSQENAALQSTTRRVSLTAPLYPCCPIDIWGGGLLRASGARCIGGEGVGGGGLMSEKNPTQKTLGSLYHKYGQHLLLNSASSKFVFRVPTVLPYKGHWNGAR